MFFMKETFTTNFMQQHDTDIKLLPDGANLSPKRGDLNDNLMTFQTFLSS